MNPLLFYEYGLGKPAGLPFISTWKTDNVSSGSSTASQVKLPLVSNGSYNMVIDWGDGSSSYITSYTQADALHTYTSPGTYTITITGNCKGWRFGNTGDRLKILSISSWGSLKFTNYSGAGYFFGCANLNLTEVFDVLDLTGIGGFDSFFEGCSSLTTINKINDWDTSSITSTYSMFKGATNFNQNIGNWNMSKVNNFNFMFQDAKMFNNGNVPDINNWDISSVSSFVGTFRSATNFNQPIGNWNTSKATTLTSMFNGASSFNQNLGSWDVSNVSYFDIMFDGATNFNNGESSDINNWVIKATGTIRMNMMFRSTNFNQPIGNWNTSAVTTMHSMFGTTKFNQNIGAWNTENVTDMSYMFQNCSMFNNGGSPDINNWNTAKVTDMSIMFTSATNFNQPIGNWNTSAVTGMRSMFSDASNFNQNIGAWNVSNVNSFANMFLRALKFNNGGSTDINNWSFKTTGAIDLSSMFWMTVTFNQPIGNWNTSNVTNMNSMFSNAYQFNQNIGSWNTSAVTDMSNMFASASVFNQNIGGWNISNVTNFSNFMYGKYYTNFSASNLDAIYNGWSSRPVKPSITVTFGSIKRTSASDTGKAILAGSPNNWVITDGGI